MKSVPGHLNANEAVALHLYAWSFRTKAAVYEIYENIKHTKYSGFTVCIKYKKYCHGTGKQVIVMQSARPRLCNRHSDSRNLSTFSSKYFLKFLHKKKTKETLLLRSEVCFLIKGEVRTINDRNICERRSCMKNNGKSPTSKFVSGEERRPSEV